MEAVEEIIATVRTINITRHFAERWAERILEIGKDIFNNTEKQKAIKDYAAQNFERIKEHANETFQHAAYIWSGQLYDNVSRNYYMEDDLVIVTNTQADAMITVYKVDFGFPGAGNSLARKSLIEEIHRLSTEKEEADFKILVELENKQHELEVTNENIRIAEQQLVNFKQHKSFVESEIKNMNHTSNHLDLQIKKYTNMLVNSKEYREDLKLI